MVVAGGRWLWLSGAAGVAAAAFGVAWWALGTGSSPSAGPAEAYTSVKACLLTGEQGVAAPPASLAWAGMRDASRRTRAQVSYLAVPGSAGANALPYLGSLLERRCDVVVSSGAAEQSAVLSVAGRFPAVRFVLVADGAAGPVAASNVAMVPVARPGLRAAVAEAVGAATAG